MVNHKLKKPQGVNQVAFSSNRMIRIKTIDTAISIIQLISLKSSNDLLGKYTSSSSCDFLFKFQGGNMNNRTQELFTDAHLNSVERVDEKHVKKMNGDLEKNVSKEDEILISQNVSNNDVSSNHDDNSKNRKSKVEKSLARLFACNSGVVFFKDSSDEIYLYEKNNSSTVYKLKSQEAKRIINATLYKSSLLLSKFEYGELVQVLEAKVYYDEDTEVHEVYGRNVEIDDVIYFRLDNFNTQVLSKEGHKTVKDCGLKFKFLPKLSTLPTPDESERVSPLEFFNISSKEDKIVLLSFLLSGIIPLPAYRGLIIQGNKGTGKTTGMKLIMMIIDPNEGLVGDPPANLNELMLRAQSSKIITMDNVTSFPKKMLNGICRVLTGSSNRARTLYTNDEITIMNAKNPIVMTCITLPSCREDFIDRFYVLTPDRVEKDSYLDNEELEHNLKKKHAKVLKYLFDLTVEVLRRIPELEGIKVDRMVKSCKIGQAIMDTTGIEGVFADIINANKDSLFVNNAMEDDFACEILKSIDQLFKLKNESRLETTTSEIAEYLGGSWKNVPSIAKSIGKKLADLESSFHSCGLKFKSKRTSTRMRYYFEITDKELFNRSLSEIRSVQ